MLNTGQRSQEVKNTCGHRQCARYVRFDVAQNYRQAMQERMHGWVVRSNSGVRTEMVHPESFLLALGGADKDV